MRIALVNTLYSPLVVGGAARSVEELAVSYADEGHQVLVATLGPEDREVIAEHQPDRVQVERITVASAFEPFDTSHPELSAVSKLAWHARESRRPSVERLLSKAIQKFDADVVHTNNIAGFGLSAWRAAQGRPLVHTIRDYYLVCTRSALFRNGKICDLQCHLCRSLKTPVRASKARPDVFVGVSQAVIDQHLKFGGLRPNDLTEVIYDFPNIAPNVTHRRSADHPHTLGMIGRMGRDKGNWLAFRAFSALPAEVRVKARMLLAGYIAAEDRHHLDAFLAAEPTASYLGENVPAADFYAETDTVIIPAQWMEPYGRVAAEALLAGCSVIASRVGGLPEAVHHFGGGIFVDEPASADSWTAAMLMTITRPLPIDTGPLLPSTPTHESYLQIFQDLQNTRTL